MKIIRCLVLFLVMISCIEPYDFVVKDTEPSLVVEGYISDKSFNETLDYPSDGRFFTIKLSTTSDVTNVRPNPFSSADVKIVNDVGSEWLYTEVTAGVYQLRDPDFKALPGEKYKLMILAGEQNYESEWESLPSTEVPQMGTIGFTEGIKEMYVIEASKPQLRPIKIITASISVSENTTGEPIYYRWHFTPLWIYKAPLAPSMTTPGYMCWASDPSYLNSYALQADLAGGYNKELFSITTIRNERIFENFSVLVTQLASSQENFNFYSEMMERNGGSALVDKPPFNLQSNLHAINANVRVSGYFGVVKEQATRWYFNRNELSYNVINTLKADCLVNYGPGGPAPECLDCREYSRGVATNIKPTWWNF